MSNRDTSRQTELSNKVSLRQRFAALMKLSQVDTRPSKPTSRVGHSSALVASDKSLNRLTVERLEARMMFALDVIDHNINELLNPVAGTSTPVVLSSNPAPTITSEATVVGGSTVAGRSAMLIARASDNESVTLLRYTWHMVSGPEQAVASFSANGTNAAGTTTVTFNRAGQYTFQVTVRDRGGMTATSSVEVDVVQVLSDLRVTNSRGSRLILNRAFAVTSTSETLTAIGVDQFNQPMQQQPDIAWSNPIKPSGSSVNLETSGNQASVDFDRIGTFGLRAVGGNRTFNAILNVAPVLTGFQVTQTNGTVIQSDSPLDVAATRLNAIVRGIDQFGNVMSAIPQFNVTTISAPQSGRISPRITDSNLSIAFNKLGLYEIRVGAGNLTQTLSINIVPTLNSLLVTTPQNRALVSSSSTTVGTANQVLSVVARDQYGIPLEQQPEFTWQTILSPSGAAPTLDASGNEVNITFARAGSYTIRAVGGGRIFDAKLFVRSTLTTIELLNPDGSAISSSTPVDVTSRDHRVVVRGYDQFGNVMANLPTITSATSVAPTGGRATVATSGANATVTFTKAGEYTIGFRTGNRIASATFNVTQTFTRAMLSDSANRNLGSLATTSGTGVILRVRALDQFGHAMANQPEFSWTTTTVPTGGDASFETSDNNSEITFDRAGNFGIRASADSKFVNITVRVSQTLSNVSITPGGANVARGTSQQFRLSATDQFGNDVGSTLPITWSATGGRITSSGVFTAGTSLGNYRITAKVGTSSYIATVTVVANQTQDVLQDTTLSNLVQSYYDDGEIDRTEMMALIRSTVTDGTINSVELADLRYLTSAQTNFQMPAHVRELARSLVSSNPANLRYRGQSLGNLIAGSTATHVNNLVDKWFLGTDDPTLTGSGVSYRNATGSLFVGLPAISQSRQGILGDCYFIASMISIGAKNASAIQNMFIDNGDDTFTVRFYGGAMGSFYQNGLISSGFVSGSGVASYVTVSRRLPTFANGTLAYSGMGLSATSSSTPLWIALAEKAYAQWNELGRSGRDGTNRYSAIEGGWMSNTNSQVLGYNSTNYPMSSASKTTLINSLNSGNAVTIGTNSSVGNGLVGGHAYVVTGYNASTDRFTLFNPWGNTHPTPLTWQQLQSNCSMFVVTNPNGSVSGGAGIVRSSISDEVMAAVGFVDVVTIESRSAFDSDLVVGETHLALDGPVTGDTVCGYDVAELISQSTLPPSDFIVIASTADSTNILNVESWIGLQQISLLES